MELWIRSQDKRKLIRVNTVEVYGYFDIVINNNEKVGEYSEQRALEVLDEIQEILETRIVSQMVYEMPKE